MNRQDLIRNQTRGGFPGGSVVKNLSANAGDTGSIPGLGRSHILWSSYARMPQLLSLCSTAWEPQLLSPRATTTDARTPQSPCSATMRNPRITTRE